MTGCGTTAASRPVQPDYCATAKPIFINKRDVISDDTARQILTHNLTGAGLCGWKK